MYLIKISTPYNTLALNEFFYYASDKEIKKGVRVNIKFKSNDVIGFVIDCIKKDETLEKVEDELGFKLNYIDEIIDEDPIINDELFNLAITLSKQFFYPLVGVLQTMLSPSFRPAKTCNSLKENYDYFYELGKKVDRNISKNEEKILQKFTIFPKIEKSKIGKSKSFEALLNDGFIKETKCKRYKYKIEKIYSYHNEFSLNEEQNKIFHEILESNDDVFLLHGVTGSGKTEVYIKCIEETLNKGKNAIVLVPEIALTPLMISRIVSYFDEEIAVLHSSLTERERYDEYLKIKNEKVRIVIGTRSAIFAPLTNIGLICVDEEDSTSYKEENTVTYNAKDVAIMRAKYYGGKVILGSATPSIESMGKALSKKYHLLELENKYNNKKVNVRLIDRNNFKNYSSLSSIFSLDLIKEIKDRLYKNEQIILFINNKGYANSLVCRECGKSFKCPNCGLSLVYHKEDNSLKCHHCNYSIKKPTHCPHCDSKYLGYVGFGIEKVEEDFKKIFNVPYLVLDNDRTPKSTQIADILLKFSKKEANVLIGTQIVSKGHDFEDVALVGIVNADSLLIYPSYKTNENAYSLLTQSIGRAGRSNKQGLALIQTSQMNNQIIKFALNDDYQGFLKYELLERKTMQNPPFFNILAIVIQSKKKDYLDDYAKDIYCYFKYLELDVIINNFSYTRKITPYYERKMFIKYKKISDIEKYIRILIDTYKSKPDISLKICINPYDY